MEKKSSFQSKKKIIFIFASVFFLSLVVAQPSFGSIPSLPDRFRGDVNINGNEAPIGTDIEIYVNSSLEKVYTLDKEGEYDLYVRNGNINDSIEFIINNKIAGTSTKQSGETINLDLSISIVSRNSGSGGSSGSSGGGSSGGGSSGGGSGGSVSDSGSTVNTYEDSGITEISNEQNNSGSETEETESEESNPGLFGITGAVIGFAKSKSGIGLIIGLFALLAIGVIYINKIKPLKWKKE